MLWLVVTTLFTPTISDVILPSPEEIHQTFLHDFLDNFDKGSLYPDEPIFDRQDFKGFPVIETTFGEDQIFYQCGPEDVKNTPYVGYRPHSHSHCGKCMEAMRSHRKTFRHQGPFLLSYKCVTILQKLENIKCSFYL